MKLLRKLGFNINILLFTGQSIYHQYMLGILAFFLEKGLIRQQRFGIEVECDFVKALQRLFLALGWSVALIALWNVVDGGGALISGLLVFIGLLIVSFSKTIWQWGHGMSRIRWIFNIARTCDSSLVEPILKVSFLEGGGIVPMVLGRMPAGVLRDVEKSVLSGLLGSKDRDIRIAALKRIG